MLTRRHLHHWLAAVLLIACGAASALFPARPPLLAAPSSTPQFSSRTTTTAWDDDFLWTRWGAEHYALVQEGDYLWIGTGGGVLHWHIPTQTQTRYTVIDGLPSHRIFAVAIDSMGNRWFGGDGGLSRLDAGGVWTHFTTANSGLHNDSVHGIAVGADGALWLSHGLPDDTVSRRAPDGSWAWSPSRAAMVASDYAAVVQTQNANALWVIADGDVWVDFAVFDGSGWSDRTPTGIPVQGSSLRSLITHSATVWALLSNGFIYQWTGGTWLELPPVVIDHSFDAWFTPSAIAVTPDGDLWLGGQLTITYPKGQLVIAAIMPADHPEELHTVDTPLPPSVMFATEFGVAAIGPSWIHPAVGQDHIFTEAPRAEVDAGVIAGEDGNLWLSNSFGGLYATPFPTQGINDQGTTGLHDDQWQEVLPHTYFRVGERTPDGDVWLNLEEATLYDWYCTYRTTMRRSQGEWVIYHLPITGPTSTHCPFITDIFAQDDHHIWFAYLGPRQIDGTSESGVLHLDDNDTPLNLDDDRWTQYPFPTLQEVGNVAVTGNSIWLATNSALYRWQEGEWQSTDHPDDRFLCDLAVAEGGYLLAHRDDSGQCGQPAVQVSLLNVADERVERIVYNSMDQFLSQQWTIARTTTQRNPLFAVDTEGAIWYFAADNLCRRAGEQVAPQCTSLPAPFAALSPLEIDNNDHIWFAADGALWRWSAQPNFALLANPGWLLMKLDSARHSTLSVQPIEGFEGAVELSVAALPPHFTAALTPAAVDAGASASLAFTTTASAALGEHLITVQAVGTSGATPITRTATITVWVAAEIYELYLSLIARR